MTSRTWEKIKDVSFLIALLVPLWMMAASITFMAVESWVHKDDQTTLTITPPPVADQSAPMRYSE